MCDKNILTVPYNVLQLNICQVYLVYLEYFDSILSNSIVVV